MKFNQLSLNRFQAEARLLLIGMCIIAISFFGVQMLLQNLYLMRVGYDLAYVGFYNAAGSLTYMVMSLVSGLIATRFGNRSMMLFGGIVTVMGMSLLPITDSLPVTWRDWFPFFSQFVLSTGWAFYTISYAPALMAATTAENRNAAFALNGTFRGFGAFVGMLIGGMLPNLFAALLKQPIDQPAPYRYALWGGAILGFAALVPILRMKNAEISVSQANKVEEVEAAFPLFGMVFLILHIYFGNSSAALCQTFCNTYMDTQLHLSTAMIGLLIGIGQFVAIVSPLIVPQLVRARGNVWVMMMTTSGVALSLLPFIYLRNWLGAGLGMIGTTTLAAMWMPALQVYQMEMVSKRWRTLAYGIFSMGMSLTYTSVSLAGGYIAIRWGYPSLFQVGMTATLLGSLIMAGKQYSSIKRFETNRQTI